jgi:RND family efflux transporter MFP subunit
MSRFWASRRIRFTSLVPVLALGAFAGSALVGCHGKEVEGLPPSSGAGAPAAPQLPKLADLATKDTEGVATPQAAWTGTLYARHEAELGPKTSGVINQITVEEGDKVKKGQLLFRLESNQAALGVEQAKAAIATAQVGADSAKLDFSRATDLMNRGSIAPAAFDQSKSANDHASTALEQAKVALRVAQRVVADSAIYSPIDGVVTSKLKSVGETATMMPPTVVLVVQDVEHLELRARLPERALVGLKDGSKLHMNIPTVQIARDVPVKRINPAIDTRTRTVEVVGDVDNADGKLKVGMLAEVGVVGLEAANGTPSDAKLADTNEPGAKAP